MDTPGTSENEMDRAVMVEGFQPNVTSDILELLFEDLDETGGGDIEQIEMIGETRAMITFRKTEVAERVLSRSQAINDIPVVVKRPQKLHYHTPEVSRTVQVFGLEKHITKKTLKLFFESKERSGGGLIDCLAVDEKERTATITFQFVEDAQKVADKNLFTVGGCELVVQPVGPPNPGGTIDSRDRFPSQAPLGGIPDTKDTQNKQRFPQDTTQQGHLGAHHQSEYALSDEAPNSPAASTHDSACFEEPNLSPTARPTQSQCMNRSDTVQISGIPKDWQLQVVSLLFENKKKTGGGEIKELDFNPGKNSARIVFKNPKDAYEVAKRRTFVCEGATLMAEMSKPQSTCQRSADEKTFLEPQNASSANLSTVRVCGVPPSVSRDYLTLCLESTRSSGGGPVLRIDYTEGSGVAVVEFENAEDAERLVQTQPKLNEESARFHILDTRASHEKPFALLVRGFAPTTTRRTIELFFDNERASGGNNVEDVEFDGKLMTAVVSFRDEGVTESVLSRQPLILEEQTLAVSRLQPAPLVPYVGNHTLERNSMIVQGIPVKCTKQELVTFLEKHSQNSIRNVVYGTQVPYAVLVVFRTDLDFQRIQRMCARYPLRGVMLSVQQVEMIDSIQIGCIEHLSKQLLELYFERKENGGGPIRETKFQDGVAIIRFREPSTFQSVMKKGNHIWEGREIPVRPFVPGLGILPPEHATLAPPVLIPAPVSRYDIGQELLQYLLSSDKTREAIEQRLLGLHCRVLWPDRANAPLKLECCLEEDDPNIQNLSKGWEKVVNEQFTKIKNELKFDTLKITKPQITKLKVQLLQLHNYPSLIMQRHQGIHVEVCEIDETITLRGLDESIQKARLEILQTVAKITSRSWKLSTKAFSVVKSEQAFRKINENLKKTGTRVICRRTTESVTVTGATAEECDRAVRILNGMITDRVLPTTTAVTRILNEPTWADFKGNVESSGLVELFLEEQDTGTLQLTIVGFCKEVESVVKDATKYFAELQSPSTRHGSLKEKQSGLQTGSSSKLCTVRVSGIPPSSSETFVMLFLENKGMSGGGPIRHIDYTQGSGFAVVEFHHARDAESVFGTNPILEGTMLSVDILDTRASNETPFALSVRGFGPTVTKKVLELFFESKRRSGGSGVEDVEIDAEQKAAVVSFCHEGVVENVFAHQPLILEERKLEISRLQPAELVPYVASRHVESKSMIVQGIPVKCSKEELVAFLEKQSQNQVINVVYGTQVPYMTLVGFKRALDFEHAQCMCARYPLRGVMLSVQEVEVVDSIQISGIKGLNRRTLERYFESEQSGGGPIQKVQEYHKQDCVTIKFSEPSTFHRVMGKKPHMLEGQQLLVNPFIPCLGFLPPEHTTSKPPKHTLTPAVKDDNELKKLVERTQSTVQVEGAANIEKSAIELRGSSETSRDTLAYGMQPSETPRLSKIGRHSHRGLRKRQTSASASIESTSRRESDDSRESYGYGSSENVKTSRDMLADSKQQIGTPRLSRTGRYSFRDPRERHYSALEPVESRSRRAEDDFRESYGSSRHVSEQHQFRVGSISLTIHAGDITKEAVEAIVNPSNASLDLTRGAVQKAIVRAGGESIVRECKNYGPVNKGIAMTTAGRMEAKCIIHLAPSDRDKRTPFFWQGLVIGALSKAEEEKLNSIAFPAIGTGSARQAEEEIAKAMVDGLKCFEEQEKPKNVKIVKFVIFHKHMVETFKTAAVRQGFQRDS